MNTSLIVFVLSSIPIKLTLDPLGTSHCLCKLALNRFVPLNVQCILVIKQIFNTLSSSSECLRLLHIFPWYFWHSPCFVHIHTPWSFWLLSVWKTYLIIFVPSWVLCKHMVNHVCPSYCSIQRHTFKFSFWTLNQWCIQMHPWTFLPPSILYKHSFGPCQQCYTQTHTSSFWTLWVSNTYAPLIIFVSISILYKNTLNRFGSHQYPIQTHS